MRVMGFSRFDWWNYLTDDYKLKGDYFTTWRWPRKDKDWHPGEYVQIVIKPRTKDRLVLGVAVIERMQAIPIDKIHEGMARADGFKEACELQSYLENERQSRGIPEDTCPNMLVMNWDERMPNVRLV